MVWKQKVAADTTEDLLSLEPMKNLFYLDTYNAPTQMFTLILAD